MFFSDYQKYLALETKKSELKKLYKKSERDLKEVAKSGNEVNLAKVMKKHGNIEYAMLYQKTPEFKMLKRF